MTNFIYEFVKPDGNGYLTDPNTLSQFYTSKTYCTNNNVKIHFASEGAALLPYFDNYLPIIRNGVDCGFKVLNPYGSDFCRGVTSYVRILGCYDLVINY